MDGNLADELTGASSGNLGNEAAAAFDAAIEAPTAQHADFDLDHIEPAGMLWCVVEFQAFEDASRL
jgi:hypothetical protein